MTNPRDPGNLCPPDQWPPVPTEYPVRLRSITPKLAAELRERGWAPVDEREDS